MLGNELTSFCLFGCALDSDEREESVKRKIEYAITKETSNSKLYYDPYDALTRVIELIDTKDLPLTKGKVEVESWLTPFPHYSDLAYLSVPNFVAFIDSEGCLEYANKVCSFTREILPSVPFLIGVDHSLSGGVLKALSEEYGVENISAIFLDSHFDGIPSTVRCEMIHYDIETNTESVFSANDPFIYGRLDSYSTESFIKFLINKKIILPENTLCIGISNYPSQKAFEINDPRVKRYIAQFTDMQHRGLTIVQKEDLRDHPETLKFIIEKHNTPYFYISIDMDVGANNTYNGVRFKDYTGLSLKEIQNVLQLLNKHALKKNTLAGMDLMEIDMHSADEKTYTSALIIIKELLASKS